MAKSTTFKGQVKPMGKSGHFYEPRRHELQAKGFKTGHLAQPPLAPPYTKWGITNLEATPEPVPETSTGLEDTQAEAFEEKELERSQNVSFGEKVRKMEQKFAENLRKEKALKAKLRQQALYEKLGKEQPEEEEPDEDEESEEGEEEEYDSDELPAKFAHFLADLDQDYTSEDMRGLSDKEVELLALKFKTQNKEGMFGEPENPFIAELKNRMEARKELEQDKAKIRAELKKPKEKEKGLLQDLFFD